MPQIEIPTAGAKITMGADGKLVVPNNPIVCFIEGDGTGPDIWAAASRMIDGAVAAAYGGARQIHWMEVYAGEKSWEMHGRDNAAWLPQSTIDAMNEYLVSIKGPMTTPIGGGIRSINVAIRQIMDLYTCLRPVKYFAGVPSPVKKPQDVDMVIFRENTEDIYCGIEFEAGSPEAAAFLAWLKENYPERADKIRFPDSCGIGIKPISREGTARIARAAFRYAIANGRKSVTIVHKGNIMKFTEGAFAKWAYEVGEKEFGDTTYGWGGSGFSQWEKTRDADGVDAANAAYDAAMAAGKITVKDAISDIALQQVLTRAKEFDVIVTMNLNGDYLSDALAAQVGGIGIAPGANINYDTGRAVFEATHGTAPKYAGLDKVNPSSVALSGEMMLRHMGWNEAADALVRGIEGAIAAHTVTYDFARLMRQEGIDDVQELSCSAFGTAAVSHM